jgi:crooked neck
VYERALEVDFQNIGLWVKYAEMEMRHKFISHARNIWERAIYYMPRVDQFWYKYSYMEEVLGNYAAAREIFSRWMTWRPEEKAWLAYLKFEERMGELEN